MQRSYRYTVHHQLPVKLKCVAALKGHTGILYAKVIQVYCQPLFPKLKQRASPKTKHSYLNEHYQIYQAAMRN